MNRNLNSNNPQNVCVWRAKNNGSIYTSILEKDQGLSWGGKESKAQQSPAYTDKFTESIGCSLCLTLEIKYSFGVCFSGISKHREESSKSYDAQRSIFDEIRVTWIADETLSRYLLNRNKN